MSKIIDQLLKIAALDDNYSSEPIIFDITKFLNLQLDDIRVLQPGRAITFIDNPLVVKAPYELLATLLTNILANIRVHTPADAPIRISIRGKSLTIEDGGPGLKEIPDKPFKRFDSSRSRETGGSGLGMSLIQKSAKAIGAKLNFGKSDLGGLRVEITFR